MKLGSEIVRVDNPAGLECVEMTTLFNGAKPNPREVFYVFDLEWDSDGPRKGCELAENAEFKYSNPASSWRD